MGKKGGKGGKYVHKHTYNPKARESDERKKEHLKNIELKRLQNAVRKQEEVMQQYLSPADRARMKKPMDKQYELKGAARVAREFYRPPDWQPDPEPVDLLEQYEGKMWAHEEGRLLLKLNLNYALGCHNVGKRTKEAIKTMKEMLRMDPADHMCARHHLLRCYLDVAAADKARELLDQFKQDTHCCFSFSRALIEHISFELLEESGSCNKLRNDALMKGKLVATGFVCKFCYGHAEVPTPATEHLLIFSLCHIIESQPQYCYAAYEANPYGIWPIVFHEYFAESLEQVDKLPQDAEQCGPGTIYDAIRFFDG